MVWSHCGERKLVLQIGESRLRAATTWRREGAVAALANSVLCGLPLALIDLYAEQTKGDRHRPARRVTQAQEPSNLNDTLSLVR